MGIDLGEEIGPLSREEAEGMGKVEFGVAMEEVEDEGARLDLEWQERWGGGGGQG